MSDFSAIPNARWAEFKSEILAVWPRLRLSEVEATGGDPLALSQLVARRYGLPTVDARKQLDTVVATFRRDDHFESAEEMLANEQIFRDQFRQF